MKKQGSEEIKKLANDFELGELQQMGGLGKVAKVFGQERFNQILVELNERVGG